MGQTHSKIKSTTLSFGWKSLPDAPAGIFSPAVVIGSKVYFHAGQENILYEFSNNEQKWSTVPIPLPGVFSFAIVNVEDTLTAVGGKIPCSHCVNNLNRFVGGEWVEDLPPMPTKRQSPTAVYADNSLVVAGGLDVTGMDSLKVVELLNVQSQQWSTVSSIPFDIYSSSAAICGGHIYIQACTPYDSTLHKVFECSIGALIKSEPSSTTWRMICPSPVNKSSLVTVNNTLLAVGGRFADEVDSNNIYQYNPNANEWQLVGEMPTPRHYCITALLPGNKLLVLGGMPPTVKKVEIATIITW